MSHRIKFALILILLTAMPLPAVLLAQGDGDDACPALVEAALATLDETCGSLARDTACYGHTRVDASFWADFAADDLAFDAPADRAPLAALQTITTHPLDLDDETWGLAALHLQAGVPETLPGQAVTFLLMGDASLENAVEPADAVEPVAAAVHTADGANANLRSGPSTTHNVVVSLADGAALDLVGVDETGAWVEVALEDGGYAWIAEFLVTAEADALAGLPVSEGHSPYGPMQSFYFTAGLGAPACHEAPDALLVQSPGGTAVTLRINDLQVTIGSTVVFTLAAVDATGQTALVSALLTGSLSAPALNVTLDAPGEAFAVTLNDAGWVDEASEVIPLPPSSRAADAVHNACLHASQIALFTAPPLAICAAEPDFVAPPPTRTPVPRPTVAPAGGSLDGVGPGDACTVQAINTVNLRGGPGTHYPQQGQLPAGQTASPAGQVQGSDGFRWWQLDGGAWLRGDLVTMAGACEAVPTVETTPVPPAAPVNTGGGGNLSTAWIHPRVCEPVAEGFTIQAGQPVMFATGCCGGATIEEQEARQAEAGSPWITLDGAQLPIYITGIFWAGTWYTNDGRYEWTATPGTHTVSGGWGSGSDSCTFTVE